jgi:hypothetical protein
MLLPYNEQHECRCNTVRQPPLRCSCMDCRWRQLTCNTYLCSLPGVDVQKMLAVQPQGTKPCPATYLDPFALPSEKFWNWCEFTCKCVEALLTFHTACIVICLMQLGNAPALPSQHSASVILLLQCGRKDQVEAVDQVSACHGVLDYCLCALVKQRSSSQGMIDTSSHVVDWSALPNERRQFQCAFC